MGAMLNLTPGEFSPPFDGGTEADSVETLRATVEKYMPDVDGVVEGVD